MHEYQGYSTHKNKKTPVQDFAQHLLPIKKKFTSLVFPCLWQVVSVYYHLPGKADDSIQNLCAIICYHLLFLCAIICLVRQMIAHRNKRGNCIIQNTLQHTKEQTAYHVAQHCSAWSSLHSNGWPW